MKVGVGRCSPPASFLFLHLHPTTSYKPNSHLAGRTHAALKGNSVSLPPWDEPLLLPNSPLCEAFFWVASTPRGYLLAHSAGVRPLTFPWFLLPQPVLHLTSHLRGRPLPPPFPRATTLGRALPRSLPSLLSLPSSGLEESRGISRGVRRAAEGGGRPRGAGSLPTGRQGGRRSAAVTGTPRAPAPPLKAPPLEGPAPRRPRPRPGGRASPAGGAAGASRRRRR